MGSWREAAFRFRDTLVAYYSGTVPGADRTYSASNFMYAALQQWAVRQGLKAFDFGRSRRDAGAFRFKVHQGFEPRLVADDLVPQIGRKDDTAPSRTGGRGGPAANGASASTNGAGASMNGARPSSNTARTSGSPTSRTRGTTGDQAGRSVSGDSAPPTRHEDGAR